MELIKIIQETKVNTLSNFDTLKIFTNTDIGHIMVVFYHKTLNSRQGSGRCGADIDNDLYLGIDASGWVLYTHTIEYNGGSPAKITESSVHNLDDVQLHQYLLSDNCTNQDFINFMNQVYNITNL